MPGRVQSVQRTREGPNGSHRFWISPVHKCALLVLGVYPTIMTNYEVGRITVTGRYRRGAALAEPLSDKRLLLKVVIARSDLRRHCVGTVVGLAADLEQLSQA